MKRSAIHLNATPRRPRTRYEFFDSFSGADATAITAHTAERQPPAVGGWSASGAPNFSLSANRLVPNVPGLEYCTPNGWLAPNFYAEIQAMNGQHAEASLAHYMMLGFRLSAAYPIDGWVFQWATRLNAGGTNHRVRLRKFVAGVETEIGYIDLPDMDYNHTGAVRLVVSGNQFKFSIDHNADWTYPYTDSEAWNITQGKFALYHASYNATPTTGWWFDNLRIVRL